MAVERAGRAEARNGESASAQPAVVAAVAAVAAVIAAVDPAPALIVVTVFTRASVCVREGSAARKPPHTRHRAKAWQRPGRRSVSPVAAGLACGGAGDCSSSRAAAVGINDDRRFSSGSVLVSCCRRAGGHRGRGSGRGGSCVERRVGRAADGADVSRCLRGRRKKEG
jgi:hypothetical protein